MFDWVQKTFACLLTSMYVICHIRALSVEVRSGFCCLVFGERAVNWIVEMQRKVMQILEMAVVKATKFLFSVCREEDGIEVGKSTPVFWCAGYALVLQSWSCVSVKPVVYCSHIMLQTEWFCCGLVTKVKMPCWIRVLHWYCVLPDTGTVLAVGAFPVPPHSPILCILLDSYTFH